MAREAYALAFAAAYEAETDWNRKHAARPLSLSYRGLLYKIRQHGITRLPGGETIPYFPNGNLN